MTITDKQREVMDEIANRAAESVYEKFQSEFEKKLEKEIIPDTVRQTLISLGADAGDSMEMQQDFHFLRKQRKRREAWEENKMKVLGSSFFGLLIAALAAYFGIGKS